MPRTTGVGCQCTLDSLREERAKYNSGSYA
jgi:hypothetical protein